MRQAGFFTGLFLLITLCAVTDWTIRLIVINAKLSGGRSYIDIMTTCFGPSGRAAVSFFQFSFAFGGQSKLFIPYSLFTTWSRHVRIWHYHRRYTPSSLSVSIPHTTHDTHTQTFRKSPVRDCVLHGFLLIPPFALSRHS